MGKNKHHNFYGHSLYRVWADMKARCYNSKNKRYDDWGGRGIRVCDEWINNPEIFCRWALGNGWEKGLCIDRIDNDGDYSPKNCRFTTVKESVHNQRLLQKNNNSGYRGVNYEKSCGKWKAQIRINGKKKHLGLFNNREIAALFYDFHVLFNNDNRPMNIIQR